MCQKIKSEFVPYQAVVNKHQVISLPNQFRKRFIQKSPFLKKALVQESDLYAYMLNVLTLSAPGYFYLIMPCGSCT